MEKREKKKKMTVPGLARYQRGGANHFIWCNSFNAHRCSLLRYDNARFRENREAIDDRRASKSGDRSRRLKRTRWKLQECQLREGSLDRWSRNSEVRSTRLPLPCNYSLISSRRWAIKRPGDLTKRPATRALPLSIFARARKRSLRVFDISRKRKISLPAANSYWEIR